MIKDFQTYINEGLFDRNQSEFNIRKTDKGIEQIYIPKTKDELYMYIKLDIEQAKKDGTYPDVNLNNIDVSETAVEEIIIKLVRKPEFADVMKNRIESKVDTLELDKEIATLEGELRRILSMKSKLIEESDSLNPDDKHFDLIRSDLSDRIYALYDKIEEIEADLMVARQKKVAINTSKLEADNIY
jgi:hypothetical protein